MNVKSFLYFMKKALSLFSLVVFMVLFQNCGTSEDSLLNELSSEEQRQADQLPFAFDLSIDTVAYMSCDSNTVNLNGSGGLLFNFKAGAYELGEGVGFRPEFLDSVGQTAPSIISTRLSASTRNSQAGVVMSVRDVGRMQTPINVAPGGESSGETGLGTFIGPMMWDLDQNVHLTQENVVSLLQNQNSRVNYLEGFPSLEHKSFDGTVSFNVLGAQPFIRQTLESTSYLTFTFATEALEDQGARARSPHSSTGEGEPRAQRSVWGRGYQPRFTKNFSQRAAAPRRVLSSLQGYDLESESQDTDAWTCSPNDRFIIVRREDALRRYDAAPGGTNVPGDPGYTDGGPNVGGYYMNLLEFDVDDIDGDGNTTERVSQRRKVVCPLLPDALGVSDELDEAFARIRRILPVEDWYVFIGSRYNCAVPKRNTQSCYGRFIENQGQQGAIIQYLPDEDFPQDVIDDNAEADADPNRERTVFQRFTECEGASTGLRFCPHYVSVCTKQ